MSRNNIRFILIMVSCTIIGFLLGSFICKIGEAAEKYDPIPQYYKKEPWKYQPINPWQAEPRKELPKYRIPDINPEKSKKYPKYIDPKIEIQMEIPA